MREYVVRRTRLLIPTMIGVTLIVFLMMRFIPDDPVTNLMGLAIFFTVLAFNLFGDGLRDALDPRLKQ